MLNKTFCCKILKCVHVTMDEWIDILKHEVTLHKDFNGTDLSDCSERLHAYENLFGFCTYTTRLPI